MEYVAVAATPPALAVPAVPLIPIPYTDRFSLPMTARTTKTALVVGLVYGGLQDIAGAARGRRIGYMDWAQRKFGLEASETPGKEITAP